MKYYIATSLSNVAKHNAVRDCLVEWGLTADWTKLPRF